MATTRTPRWRPASERSLATWTQSSRVGTTTRACGTSRVRSAASPSAVAAGRSAGGTSRCSSGTPKPSVLPMPVRAWPMMSSPASASGSVRAWMANVRTMPASASACTISGRAPSSAKVGESSLTGAPAWSGCASGASSGDSVEISGEISGESSVGTDRVIASLRALLPGPARRPPATWTPTGQESRQGAARTMSVAAPGDFRWPRQGALAARCGPSYPDGPADVRSWSGESGHMIAPQPAAAPLDGRIAKRRRATVAPQVI